MTFERMDSPGRGSSGPWRFLPVFILVEVALAIWWGLLMIGAIR
jgi:hypothetical protein